MRLSTSTNIFAVNPGGPLTNIIDCLRVCAGVGYKVFDINLRFIHFDEFFLIHDDWRQKTEIIANEATKLGIEFSQSHIPYYQLDQVDKFLAEPELYEWKEEMCRRAYHASSMLGVKWAAVHTFTATDHNCERTASRKHNVEYLSPYIELSKKLDVGVAIENMCDFHGSIIPRRYAATYEDLVELVDEFNDESVGVCWDFGHANIMGYDQNKALRYIGKRLKSTHVNDNFGILDTHNIPFVGTIAWQGVMKTLTDIGYDGDFTYEIHGMGDYLPEELKLGMIERSFEVGQYLLSMIKE